jgi:Major Facilitator Superfamily/Staphylococcal nuclease homologue
LRHPPARRISIFALTGLDLRVLATIASLLALYVLLNWLPTLLGDRGLSKAHASLVSMLFGIGGAVGVLILADLLDRRGRRRMIGLWHLGLIASLIALAVVNSGFLATALAGFAVGFLVSTAPLPLYGMAPCYYGMSMRGAGVGVSVADGRLGAIFGPLLAAAPLGRRRGRVGRPPGPAAQHRGGRRRHHGPDRSSAAGRLTHPRGRSGGVDAPESSQLCRGEDSLQYRCGAQAANDLDSFIARRPVNCLPRSLDPYGRTVATCLIGGTDLGEWLVRNGLALDWPQYSKGRYDAVQRDAERAGRRI